VRSALEDLERRGLVLRHVGGGAFLAPGQTAVGDRAGESSPAEIMVSRLAWSLS
jgi:DNA-binding GntR family transcriptional regulator